MKKLLLITKYIFKSAPISTLITLLFIMYSSVIPAVTALVSVKLFDSAEAMIMGNEYQYEPIIYALFLFLLLLIRDILGTLNGVVKNTGVFEKSNAMFNILLYQKAARLPLIAYENADILDKKERAEKAVDNEILPRTFYRFFTILESCLASIGIAVILAKYYIWLLPISILSVFPFFIARIFRGKEFYRLKKMQTKSGRKLKYLWELFSLPNSVKEMRVMGFDSYLAQKWQTTRDTVNDQIWKLERRDAFSLLICDGLRILSYGASIIIVLILALNGTIPLGVFGASIASFLNMQNNIKYLLIGLGSFPEYLAYASDYFSFFDLPEDENGYSNFIGLKKTIALDKVSFRYPGSNENALEEVSLTIRKGETVVIVGENGSGKTTLSKLILGLYEPISGTIKYDGVNLKSYNKESLYKRVSVIQQDFVKYQLSLRENIAISDVSKLQDDESIIRNIHESRVHSNIKLDDQLGKTFGGTDLSGGEWQKLAIARGLFKDSELIILDEPTASLDPIIENEILSKFIEATKKKTAVIISHRIGICTKADKIVVLKSGRVVETGNHSELISANGEYARLFNEQAKWYI